MKHVSYPSKKLLIKPRFIRTSSRWWVLLWKDYGWFLIDYRFFVKFHRSGPAIIFSFWTIMEHVSYPSKKLIIKQRFIKTSSRWWVLFWKDYRWFFWCNCRFSIFGQISQVRTCNNFQFLNYHGACKLSIKKAPNQAKIYQDLIIMVSDRIVHFRFFVKFHRSGPAIV